MMESKMDYIKETEGKMKQASWNTNHNHHRNHRSTTAGIGDHHRRRQHQWSSRGPNTNNYNTASSTSNTHTWSTNNSSSSSHVASLPAATTSSAVAMVGGYEEEIPAHLLNPNGDEYPQTIQELVMNGFELQKVIRAFDLIGDNFEDLLAFLMNS